MNLLCGAVKNLWYNFYNNCIKNLDDKTKITVGMVCLLVSIGLFILCTKGHNKADMVNNWFLFWLSLIVFVVSMLYLCVF
jgi:hypothetical protein